MDFNILKYTGRFILLAALQIFILNNIYLGGYVTPFVYPLFILLLPFDVKGWILLISAFLGGLVIDVFSDTLGLHTAASVFMAFARPGIIRLISNKTDFDAGTEPILSTNGFSWLLSYTLILIFLHHLFLFFFESFRADQFIQILLRAVFSVLPSVGIIMIIHLLFDKSKPKRS